ncbi:MAG: DUF4395 family protein [Deltaproteobacteria bacterium]|nr:DUF4395 family protein [Deltaproteobacteria bacterium]MBW1876597.1 DUF4395 family protein [Deltaproteobacteria bacterium]MBW2211207.1 DUF4395 family protein [Deltaproteobacteria bacterium]MBW2551860.1 DUF4395 family protein [Deltaproteobacteria bacterium]MBW2628082.1 DUF4395 family protein [Deltaproteobacteria bacterium]
MAKNHTRKYLQIQGFNLDDDALAEIGQWMRWPYVFCASILAVGVALASPGIIWTLSAIAIATVFLPSHPFNYVYNYGVRHLTGTCPLPQGTVQGKFSCGVGGVWLVGTGAAFFTGATTVGYVSGGVMVAMATLVATTHVCIPSMIYNAFFERKQTQPA